MLNFTAPTDTDEQLELASAAPEWTARWSERAHRLTGWGTTRRIAANRSFTRSVSRRVLVRPPAFTVTGPPAGDKPPGRSRPTDIEGDRRYTTRLPLDPVD